MLLIPQNAIETEYSIKKSRFIARAAAAQSRAQAMQQLAQAQHDYPDARHHCWAYLLGECEASSNAGMSDDGEPSGTAGKPILNVIQHSDVGNIMLIVIRYFGGIKLGAGGLVRAYSAAAQQGIAALSLQRPVPMVDCRVELNFAQEQALRHLASLHDARIITVAYTNKVNLTLQWPEQAFHELENEAAMHHWRIHQQR